MIRTGGAWRGFALATLLIGAGGAVLAEAPLSAPAAQPAPGAQDGLTLFEAMMPVFTHPRCTNCHGGVDPSSDSTHDGGAVAGFRFDEDGVPQGGNEACLECHTARTQTTTQTIEADPFTGTPASSRRRTTGPWAVPQKSMSLVGKDAATICRQVKELTGEGTGDTGQILAHLAGDDRIDLAFEGRKGMDEQSPFWGDVVTDPPPMTKQEFLQAAQRWINEGQASCEGPSAGTITYELTATEDQPPTPQKLIPTRGRTSFLSSFHRTRRDTITAHLGLDGRAHVEATHDMTYKQQDQDRGAEPCGSSRSQAWSVDGLIEQVEKGEGSGDVPWNLTLLPDGTYTLQLVPQTRVRMPSTLSQHSTLTAKGVCGPPSSNGVKEDSKVTNQDSDVQVGLLTVHGQVDPDNPTVFRGSTTETHPDQPGSPVIKITWDLTSE